MTQAITTEWLESIGCKFSTCFSGPDVAVKNGREIAYRDYKWKGFGPPKKWVLIEKPRFRVKAISQQLQGQCNERLG